MTLVDDATPEPPGVRGRGPRRPRSLVGALAALVALAAAGWIAAGQIKSPAQIAAEAQPPPASPITVPVERRVLSTRVIVRGTARFGGRSTVELGTSQLKQGSGIVTSPPRLRATLRPGSVAMTVDTRPVFTLTGRVPMNRDLVRGSRGADVLQLEAGLADLGLGPVSVDGVFDPATQAAVATFYTDRGYEPFAAGDAQLDRVTAAQDAAATARQTHLQARDTLAQLLRGTTPGDLEQARIDAATAQDTLDTARLAVPTARVRVASARAAAAAAEGADDAAAVDLTRDQAAADADVAVKQEAVTAAIEEQRLAILQRDGLPIDTPQPERDAANAAVARAADGVLSARAELIASTATADGLRANGPRTIQQARDDAANLQRDAGLAVAELRRAERGVVVAERQVRLTRRRAEVLAQPPDSAALRDLVRATDADARRTQAVASRLAAEAGISVPADELLFLERLPARVEDVKVLRGGSVSGPLMTVTGEGVIVDSSLSADDLKFVRVGDPVVVDDQDLGIRVRGRVQEVSTTPGTHRVDPSRFYLGVALGGRVARSLIGASVRLTIAVRSTRGKVLAVPISAVSVAGDGSSRVQVSRGGRTELVPVVPGLAAEGYVAVRPTGGGRLGPQDVVVVGSRGATGGGGP